MSAHPGFYSLMQFCPDHSRLECANVGVVLGCPALGFFDVRLTTRHDRLARMFGKTAFRPLDLEAAKQAMAFRLRSDAKTFLDRERFRHFIGTLANDLVFTDPRPLRVTNPSADLDALFRELVEPPAREEPPEFSDEVRKEAHP
jgi:hypothetical protein